MSDETNGHTQTNYNPETGRNVTPVKNGCEVEVYTTDVEDTIRCEAVVKTRTIPVVFLPGIMGSNLKVKGDDNQDKDFKDNYLWKSSLPSKAGCSNQTERKKLAQKIIESAKKDDAKKVWSIFHSTGVAGYLFKGREGRQRRLNPEKTTVDYCPDIEGFLEYKNLPFLNRGPGIFDKNERIDLAIALMRGWGSVSGGFYWDILKHLQKSLDAMPCNASPDKASQVIKSKMEEGDEWNQLLNASKGSAYEYESFWGNKENINVPAFSTIYAPKKVEQLANGDIEIEKLKDTLQSSKYVLKQPPTAITDEQIKKAVNYRYIVYASGYNWLNSNMVSANGGIRVVEAGEDIYDFDDCLHHVIDNILTDIQEHHDAECDKVILVTHSMGGLVARAYATKYADKVLGVIHGVMPATGAATMYKRLRAGFGGSSENHSFWKFPTPGKDWVGDAGMAKVLGDNAYTTSAIMTHSVGVLELAPSDKYGDNIYVTNLKTAGFEDKSYKHWLQIYKGKEEVANLPKLDPYEEIYKSDKWYGLVPKYQKDNDPDDPLENKRIDPRGMFNYKHYEAGEALSDFQYFIDNVEKANIFHMEQVSHSSYHPNTYACSIIDSSSFTLKTFGRMVWQADKDANIDASVLDFTLDKDDASGTLTLKSEDGKTTVKLSVAKKDDAGDGTVPGVSAIAPAAYIKETWQLSNAEADHGSSWNAKNAQLFALYAITKIMQSADG